LVIDDPNIQICYNDKILAEYKDVFARDKFKKYNFDATAFNDFISFIKATGFLLNPVASSVHFADEDDRIFYDTAKQSNAILVTGNIKHFPKEQSVMLPDKYIQKMTVV